MRIDFQLAGLTFRQQKDERTLTMKPSGKAEITPEPDNKFDPLALQVSVGGVFLGYIPSDKTQEKKGLPPVQSQMHEALKAGLTLDVEVESYCYRDNGSWNNDDKGRLGAVTLMWNAPDGLPEPVKKEEVKVFDSPVPNGCKIVRSFNEPGVEVLFHEGNHTYHYQGKQLQSVTRRVASMYEPFDGPTIAARCEKSFGMPASDILEMWRINGEATSLFGSAVHGLMENYRKFGERGLPKMPVLKDIVESFPWGTDPVDTEVLITSVERGVCGLCDRLVHAGDVLRVEDYKVNMGCEDIKSSMRNLRLKHLPNNKLGKYCAQMSMYSQMLAESGLGVSNEVVAWVWDGEWKRYPMVRIQSILDA